MRIFIEMFRFGIYLYLKFFSNSLIRQRFRKKANEVTYSNELTTNNTRQLECKQIKAKTQNKLDINRTNL